jgi:two-component system, cell cycle response regulator DivK
MNANTFTGWRILAVDDEPDNLNLLADLMEFQGADVKRTENAQQALAALDDYHPSVILLDLSMPGMDGWELHRQLRTRAELAHIPIIAITALAMPTDVERASAEGFDGYITKPFRIQSLLSDIRACVDKFASKSSDGASHPV